MVLTCCCWPPVGGGPCCGLLPGNQGPLEKTRLGRRVLIRWVFAFTCVVPPPVWVGGLVLGFLEGLVSSQLFGLLLYPRIPRTGDLNEVTLDCTARPPDDWELKSAPKRGSKSEAIAIWPEIFMIISQSYRSLDVV